MGATLTFNNRALAQQFGKYVTITEGEVDAMAVCEMFDDINHEQVEFVKHSVFDPDEVA